MTLPLAYDAGSGLKGCSWAVQPLLFLPQFIPFLTQGKGHFITRQIFTEDFHHARNHAGSLDVNTVLAFEGLLGQTRKSHLFIRVTPSNKRESAEASPVQ